MLCNSSLSAYCILCSIMLIVHHAINHFLNCIRSNTNFAEISREGDIAEEEPEKPSPVVLTKRHQIAAELQQTERNYVDTLTTLIKVRHLCLPL